MLASGPEILELIPQRHPMVMVDSLLHCDGSVTVTELVIREDNIFTQESGFSPSGMMEAMAQTAATRTGWLMKKKAGVENKQVPIGVIGSIKNFKLYFQPVTGSTITTTIEVQHEIMQATVVKGKVEVNGSLAAEAELQIFLTQPDTQ